MSETVRHPVTGEIGTRSDEMSADVMATRWGYFVKWAEKVWVAVTMREFARYLYAYYGVRLTTDR